MQRRGWARTAIVGGMVVLAVGVALWRSGVLPSRDERATHGGSETGTQGVGGPQGVRDGDAEPAKVLTTEQALRRGQREFATVATLTLAEIAASGTQPSVADVRRLLQQATVLGAAGGEGAGGDAAPLADVQKLIDAASEFLYYRFFQDSASSYRGWRTRNGYTMASAERMRDLFVDKDCERFLGKPYPGDEKLVEIFDELWSGGFTFRDESARPTRVATDADGLCIALGRMGIDTLGQWPALETRIGRDDWVGPAAGGFRNWWQDPHSGFPIFIRTHSHARTASVGLIMEFARGDRFPIRVLCYQDRAGKWWIAGLNVLNIAPDRMSIIEY